VITIICFRYRFFIYSWSLLDKLDKFYSVLKDRYNNNIINNDVKEKCDTYECNR